MARGAGEGDCRDRGPRTDAAAAAAGGRGTRRALHRGRRARARARARAHGRARTADSRPDHRVLRGRDRDVARRMSGVSKGLLSKGVLSKG